MFNSLIPQASETDMSYTSCTHTDASLSEARHTEYGGLENACIVFFQYDPRYSNCSHVLPFDAKVLILYMEVIDALLLRLGKKYRPTNSQKISIGYITPIFPKCLPNSNKKPRIQPKINIFMRLSPPLCIQAS